MGKPGYVSLTEKDKERMERLEKIREAVDKRRRGAYPVDMIEVLPPVEFIGPRQVVRYKRRHSGGKMS